MFYQVQKNENRYMIEGLVLLDCDPSKIKKSSLESHESFSYQWVS